MKAMKSQGFVKDAGGVFQVPADRKLSMRLPTELVPKCPDDGSDVVMNLRVDDTFLEDAGWHRASAIYADFLRRHEKLHILYLELGVGENTPLIVKYPFWQMTMANRKAVYACINYGRHSARLKSRTGASALMGILGKFLRKFQLASIRQPNFIPFINRVEVEAVFLHHMLQYPDCHSFLYPVIGLFCPCFCPYK